MVQFWKSSSAPWLVAGLFGGLFLATAWPNIPLRAVATDRQENFAICTGPVDEDMEAVFVLDFLTGELKAAVISPLNGKFNAVFEKNILGDLQVDINKNPRYVMVTGMANLRRSPGNVQPGRSIVYVAELTGGYLAAYGVPWNRGAANSGNPIKAPLLGLDVIPFRTAAIREN